MDQATLSDHQGVSDSICRWSAHPARQRPGATAVACTIIALVAAATWSSFGLPWAVGSLGALALALNRFFVPSTFVIDAAGITARYPLRRQRLSWNVVRRFVTDEHGGYLSTRALPSRLDAYRGMHLLFGPQRDAPIRAIRARLSIPGAVPSSPINANCRTHATEPACSG